METSTLKFGNLILNFFWEIIKDRPPIEFTINIQGLLVLPTIFLAAIAVFFFIGLASKALFEYRTLKSKITDAKKELEEVGKSTTEEEKKLREIKNRLSQEEEKKIKEELGKTIPKDGHNWKLESSRMKHWRMLEEKYKKN